MVTMALKQGRTIYWGIVIIATAFFINFVSDGMRYAFGLLFTEFLEYFSKGEVETAWVGSLFFSVPFWIAPLSGIFVKRYGCRCATVVGGLMSFVGILASSFSPNLYFLYFSLGFVTAVGFSLTFISQTLIVIEYFKDNRTLAVGVAVCGSGIGGTVFSQMFHHLVIKYTWRGTLLITSAIAFNKCVAGALMRPKRIHFTLTENNEYVNVHSSMVARGNDQHIIKNTNYQTENNLLENEEKIIDIKEKTRKEYPGIAINEEEDKTNKCNQSKDVKPDLIEPKIAFITKQLYRDPKLYLLAANQLLVSIAYGLTFTYIPETALATGHSKHQAAWLLSTISITNTVCRVITGYFGDKSYVNRAYVIIASLFVHGAAATVFAFSQSYTALVISCAFIGVSLGTFVTLLPVVLTDIFDESMLSEVYSICIFGYGPGSIVGPFLAAWIIAATGQKQLAFVASGVSNVIAGLLLIMCYRISIKEKREDDKHLMRIENCH